MTVVETHSELETISFGERFAEELSIGDIVLLSGDLGAGKTHFVKGVAKGLGHDESHVNSPTFTLIHEYKKGRIPIYHVDAYRLKGEQEAIDIGLEDILYGDGITLIEWPERIKGLLPNGCIEVQIKKTGTETRRFSYFRQLL
jgi:tRNA threonylcarbamoyladenosine biosynthesis protein TsaE